MPRDLLFFVLFFGLIACKSTAPTVDYLGQQLPDSVPVMFAPDIVSKKGRLEHGISVAPDTRELAFGVLNENDFKGEIWSTQKHATGWDEPSVFEPLKGTSAYLPHFSPDGKSLLFAKSKHDTLTYLTDIWILRKNKGNWTGPEKLNDPISTSSREAMAGMTLERSVYFSSNSKGNGLADLYFSPFQNGSYQPAIPIVAVNTERDEESIFISPNANYMIFSSYLSDESGPDLLISYKNSQGNWTIPKVLDQGINTANWERRPFVSIDHRLLFFTRMIFNSSGLEESDIYWVNTQKLFKPFVFNPIPETVVPLGKTVIIQLPLDYFKDIDDRGPLKIDHVGPLLDWVKFDSKKMTFTLTPNKTGTFELALQAEDSFSNTTVATVTVVVSDP